jgi:penicillin-binding protein-related factor A (putative recombinase)
VSDYGRNIDYYLKTLEAKNGMEQAHMTNHKVNGVYRAKMVDWMVEVLTAFKCADQTFFLAVNIMDRYFDALNKQGIAIELH